ncbi:hypothetical protein ACX80W_04985 [Arthrobacter sp. TMN-37]
MSVDASRTVPNAPAPRIGRPSWRDPRLLVGLLLVLASTAGVVALVGSLDRTTEVLAARTELPVGARLESGDLVTVAVRLGSSEKEYLRASADLPEDAVITRLVREGELVPAAAVGRPDELDRKPVGLPVEDPLPAGTEAGARVDVWVALPGAAPGQGSRFEPPRLLLEGAEVSEIVVGESALGAGSPSRVYVLVADGAMPDLLNALSNEAKIAVVLNPRGGP